MEPKTHIWYLCLDLMYVYDKKMYNENGMYAKSKWDEENDDEKDDGR